MVVDEMDGDATAATDEPLRDPALPPYRLPGPLHRQARVMPVSETAPRVPAALRAFNRGTPSPLRVPPRRPVTASNDAPVVASPAPAAAPPAATAPSAAAAPSAAPAPTPPPTAPSARAQAPPEPPMPPVVAQSSTGAAAEPLDVKATRPVATPPAVPQSPRREPAAPAASVAASVAPASPAPRPPATPPLPLRAPRQVPRSGAATLPVSSPAQLRTESAGALLLSPATYRTRRRPLSWIRRPQLIDVIPLVAVGVILAGAIAVIHGRPSSETNSPPVVADVATLIDQARQRAAAGDPAGAATFLEQRAETATPGDRLQLREGAASVLINASGVALQAGDPVGSLALLAKAAELTGTQGGAQGQLALPIARVTAARFLIDQDTATSQAADLLRQTITDAPLSSAAATARDLLARPVKVRGQLTVAGQPGAGLVVVLFAVLPSSSAADPQPASRAPLVSATSDSAGAFDLGSVAPGAYLFGFTDVAGHLHRAAGTAALITVAPAQLNKLTAAIPS
jgi:hypothetical protein